MYQCIVKNDLESAQATAELRLGGEWDVWLIMAISLFYFIIVSGWKR